MTTLLNWNNWPCDSFLKWFPNTFEEGQCSTFIPLLDVLSFTKRCLMPMCLELPVRECLPFFTINVALWLSWHKELFSTACSCSCTKRNNQTSRGAHSLTPTSSTYAELFTLSFCLLHVPCSTPVPFDSALPFWLFIPGFTDHAASTHMNIEYRIFAPILCSPSIVTLTSTINSRISFHSAKSLIDTLVQR